MPHGYGMAGTAGGCTGGNSQIASGAFCLCSPACQPACLPWHGSQFFEKEDE